MNDRQGLEHGFTIFERPAGGDGEQLRLVLNVEGGFVTEVLPGERDVRFTGPANIAYSGLSAWDAGGNELEVGFEAADCGLAIPGRLGPGVRPGTTTSSSLL